MKKSKKKIYILGLFVLIIVVCLIVFHSNYNVYKLSPAVCNTVLGVSPGDFVFSQGQNTLLVNEYTYATMDGDGNLILILTNNERDDWKSRILTLAILDAIWGEESNLDIEFMDPQNDFAKTLFESATACGLELSKDYTRVIAESDDRTLYYPWFINMGVTMQMFEGVPSEKIRVEYIEYDDNNQIVKRVIWPDNADENGTISSSQ